MGFWKKKQEGGGEPAFRVTPPEPRASIALRYLLDELYISPSDGSLLGLSFERQTLVLGTTSSHFAVSLADIAAVETVENGVTLTQTNRGSQLLGAAVGGAALGAFGALAGALTGSTRSSQRLNGLFLKVTVDDATNPVRKVTFLPEVGGSGEKATSKTGQQALSAFERMFALLSKSVRQADRQQSDQRDVSNLDELERLFSLRQSGALTEQEFVAEKSKVLLGSVERLPEDGLGSLVPERNLSVRIYDWGPVIGIHLVQLLQETWPEMKLSDAMTAAVHLQKSASPSIVLATAGEAARLKDALMKLGARTESTSST